MSHPNQPDEVELAQAYFYGLLQNPQTLPPPGLDPQMAKTVRWLVATEQRTIQTAQPSLSAAQQRVWQRIVAQSQPVSTPKRGSVSLDGSTKPQRTDYIAANYGPVKNLGQSLRTWGRWAVVASMTATVVLILAIIALIVFSTRLGENQAAVTQPAASQATTTSIPVTVINKAAAAGVHNYKIVLQARTVSPDPKQIKATLPILEQRVKTAGFKLISSTLQNNQQIVLEIAGVTAEKQLLQLLTATGRVEVIALNGAQVGMGDIVQTTYCTTGSLAQTKTALCQENGGGRVDAAGQPFQTIISNDAVDQAKINQSNPDEVNNFINMLGKIWGKYSTTNPNTGIAVVMDGQVKLTGIQINNLPGNSQSDKSDLNSLTALLKYGLLPQELEVVSSIQQ